MSIIYKRAVSNFYYWKRIFQEKERERERERESVKEGETRIKSD